VNTIGGFSTALGNACKCDPWAVEIFAEEVVRGGPAFAISLVISGVEPRLRQLAELGAWQVGSAACATTVVCWQAVLHLCGPGMLTGGHQICEKKTG
jgi:alpha-glucan,water dikinase